MIMLKLILCTVYEHSRKPNVTCTCTVLQVDVVYIGNLHIQHLQSVLMMFEAGKPVLCEKPMTTSVKNAISMIQASRDKGLFLMEVRRRL